MLVSVLNPLVERKLDLPKRAPVVKDTIPRHQALYLEIPFPVSYLSAVSCSIVPTSFNKVTYSIIRPLLARKLILCSTLVLWITLIKLRWRAGYTR